MGISIFSILLRPHRLRTVIDDRTRANIIATKTGLVFDSDSPANSRYYAQFQYEHGLVKDETEAELLDLSWREIYEELKRSLFQTREGMLNLGWKEIYEEFRTSLYKSRPWNSKLFNKIILTIRRRQFLPSNTLQPGMMMKVEGTLRIPVSRALAFGEMTIQLGLGGGIVVVPIGEVLFSVACGMAQPLYPIMAKGPPSNKQSQRRRVLLRRIPTPFEVRVGRIKNYAHPHPT